MDLVKRQGLACENVYLPMRYSFEEKGLCGTGGTVKVDLG